MARAYHNWKRLGRATLQREQLRGTGQGHGRTSSGLTGTVPPSLGKRTNIDAILEASNVIHDEDSNVARLSSTMAQNLDPNSDGGGVLQFKTGLMSIIK